MCVGGERMDREKRGAIMVDGGVECMNERQSLARDSHREEELEIKSPQTLPTYVPVPRILSYYLHPSFNNSLMNSDSTFSPRLIYLFSVLFSGIAQNQTVGGGCGQGFKCGERIYAQG